MPAPHRVIIAVFPDVDLLDVTGPAEVFAVASREMPDRPPYQVLLAGPDGGQVRTAAGVRLATDLTFAQVHDRVDTLVVPGAVDRYGAPVIDPHLVGWIGETARHARRVASVCVGAHLLAATGFLAGRTATTHWATADHPDVVAVLRAMGLDVLHDGHASLSSCRRGERSPTGDRWEQHEASHSGRAQPVTPPAPFSALGRSSAEVSGIHLEEVEEADLEICGLRDDRW
ncbi:DJ-1/PfpI family protein [Microbispora siamensis]